MDSEIEQNQLVQNTSENNVKYLIIVTLVAIVIALPIIYGGFPKDAHDSPAQFNLYKSFAQQLWMGELYPRWLLGMNDGFGSPTFFFYPPVAYYITSFFSLFSGQPTTDAQVWQQLGFSVVLASVLSSITCYLWLKDFVSPVAAIIGAIVYLIVPYHLTVDLYTRGALAEVWAFVWMPLILKFVRDISNKPIKNFVGLAISYSLLIMTHIPTTLLFSIIPVAYSLFIKTGKKRKILFVLTGLAMALGVGIADVYLLPALVTQNYIAMNPSEISPFYYAKNFLLPFGENTSDYIFQLSLYMVTVFVGIIFCVVANAVVSEKLKKEWIFWLIVSLISIFMMLPLSKFIWQLISILQSVQFPYRFNTILCLAFVAILSISFNKVSFKNFESEKWQMKLLIGGIGILCCAWIGLSIDTIRKDKIDVNNKEYIEKVYKLKLEFVDAMPKTARMDILDDLIKERNASGLPHFLLKDNAQATVEFSEWKSRNIGMNINTQKTTVLTVGQFYYPGWEATIYPNSGKSPIELKVIPSDEGLLKVEIPAESGQLKMTLPLSQAERSGLYTSFVSLIALGISVLILIRYKKFLVVNEGEIING